MTFLGTLAQLTNLERSTLAGQGLLGLPLVLSFHCHQCRRFAMSQQRFGLDRIVPHFPCSNYILKISGILETFILCKSDGWVPGDKMFPSQNAKCKMCRQIQPHGIGLLKNALLCTEAAMRFWEFWIFVLCTEGILLQIFQSARN